MIRQGRIESLTLGARDATPHEFRDINLAGRIDERVIEIDRIQGEFERTRIEAHGRIDATTPFATALQAKLATTVQDRSISATVDASGSLERLHVTLTGDDAAARAQVKATLRLFAAVPVESLDARIDALDPSLWLEGVPVDAAHRTHDARADAAQRWTLGRGRPVCSRKRAGRADRP